MTTSTHYPPPRTQAPPPRRHTGITGWLHAWRLAIRLAWRDAQRHRARSSVMVAMVLLPVMLLTVAGTILNSVADPVDAYRYRVGSAQGFIHGHQIDGYLMNHRQTLNGVAYPRTQAGNQQLIAALEKAMGATLLADDYDDRRMLKPDGEISPRLGGRAVDARHEATRPFATLLSGRWAENATEMVVTPRGVAEGMPKSGTVQMVAEPGKATTTMTVVGMARVADASGGAASYVVHPDGATDRTRDFMAPQGQTRPSLPNRLLVVRPTAPTLSEAQSWLAWGAKFYDRDRNLITDTGPSGVSYTPFLSGGGASESVIVAGVLFLTGVITLAVLMTMLVGPAFAISAARQRRNVALAVLNGATAAHARRTLLAQALVLGSVASVVGATLGVVLVAVGWPLAQAWLPFMMPFYPPHFPWPWLLLLAVFGGLTACIAAILPSRALGGLAVQQLSRRPGSDAPAPARRAVVGAVLLVIGVALGLTVPTSYLAFLGQYRYAYAAVAFLCLVFGSLLVLAWIVQQLAARSRRVALPVRLALRDATRHRRRTLPAIAAIAVSVALATGVSVVGVGEIVKGGQTRGQSVPTGWVYSHLNGPESSTSAVDDVRAAAQTEPLLVRTMSFGAKAGTVIRPVDPYCHRARNSTPGVSQVASPAGSDCFLSSFTVSMGSPDVLGALGGLHPEEIDALKAGTVLVSDPGLVRDGGITVRLAPANMDSGNPAAKASFALPEVRLPARALSTDRDDVAWTHARHTILLLLPDAVAGRHQLATEPLLAAAKPADDAAAQRCVVQAERRGKSVSIEPGDTSGRNRALVLLALLVPILLIVLVSVLTTTSLTLQEQRDDMATYAAVGATARLRRRLAAAHAGTTALLGSGVGVFIGVFSAVGLMMGDYAYRGVGRFLSVDPDLFLTSRSLTNAWLHFPVDAFPWEWCLAALVLVPAIAAASATLLARREPVLARRRDAQLPGAS